VGHQNGHEIRNNNIFIWSHTIAKLGRIIIKCGKKDVKWSENYNNMNVCNVLTLQNFVYKHPADPKNVQGKTKNEKD
jgi:hypothetical protein